MTTARAGKRSTKQAVARPKGKRLTPRPVMAWGLFNNDGTLKSIGNRLHVSKHAEHANWCREHIHGTNTCFVRRVRIVPVRRRKP